MVDFTRICRSLDRTFGVSLRGSTLSREFRGGLVTFLTMSYILLLNPQILGRAGLNKEDVGTGTGIVCGIGSLLVGVAANVPLAIGPGMGLNTYFSGLVVARVVTVDQALTATFMAGVITIILAAFNLATLIMQYFPKPIKTAVMVGIGMYQAFIGAIQLGLVVPNYLGGNLLELGNLQVKGIPLALAGLLLMANLLNQRVPGSILIGIVVVTLLSWFVIQDSPLPERIVKFPSLRRHIGDFDFSDYWKHAQKLVPLTITMAFIGLTDVGGIIFAIGRLMKLDDRSKKERVTQKIPKAGAQSPTSPKLAPGGFRKQAMEILVPSISELSTCSSPSVTPHALTTDQSDLPLRRDRTLSISGVSLGAEGLPLAEPAEPFEFESPSPLVLPSTPGSVASRKEEDPLPGYKASSTTFLVNGFCTCLAAVVGCSPTIVFLECSAGVQEGARTGLASVVTGLLFLMSLIFIPVFSEIPLAGTSPVLILLGSLMISGAADIDWQRLDVALPCFLTIVMMPFTADIWSGILFGVSSYLLTRIHLPILATWEWLRARKQSDEPFDFEDSTENSPLLP